MSSSAIKVLHVGKMIPPPYAGMEAHVDTLLRALSKFIDCTLVASDTERSRDVGLSGLPYRVRAVPTYGSMASTMVSPGLLGAVREEFAGKRANLLHVHAPNPWGDLAVLQRAREVPTIMTWHSDIVRQQFLFRTGYRRFQERALRRIDRIVVFTPAHYASSEQLHAVDVENKLVHVPMGIDVGDIDSTALDEELTGRIDAWSRGRIVILSVGRHVYYKGYEHLLSAMSRINSDSVLMMIGAGPLSDRFRRQIRELGLERRVWMLGEVSREKVVTALRRCDVFCLPSIARSEAFGIATAEAMACGKPAVVCDLGNGVNYLNIDGVTSLVVPPGDEDALADAIDTLARNASLRARMGRAGSARVRSEFAVDAMRDGTLAVYRDLLSCG